MTKPPSLANRDLSADQAGALFETTLPALASGLGADRTWPWWSGPKQDDATRKTFVELGWRFSGKPHTLADGRIAHWYHSCGGPVIFRRKARPGSPAETETTTDTPAASSAHSSAPVRTPARRVTPTSNEGAGGDPVSTFMNFAKALRRSA